MIKPVTSYEDGQARFLAHRALLEQHGVYTLPSVRAYTPDPWKYNALAMDAQPGLITEPNAGIPALFTTIVDPTVYEILLAPNKAAEIIGEQRKGDWTQDTAMFPVVEREGEVSSYGDYNENGHAGANANWPQRQNYLFQVIKEYGERELDRAGAAKINWVTEIDKSAATALNKFLNLSYFYGIAGLQNYGILNDPNLSAFLTPSTKAAGGTAWVTASGQINATANEIYADIQALFYKLVVQSQGLIDQSTPMVLAMSPGSEVGLTATNTFNVNVTDLLKKNFPNIKIATAVQYAVLTGPNPQGYSAGNVVQLIADAVEGQDMGYGAFSEKMRSHPVIRGLSSFRQKTTSGSWGAIIRQPFCVASMVGI